MGMNRYTESHRMQGVMAC